MANSDEIRWQQRFENLGKALAQLEAACAQDEYSDLERAGLVQMFEFTMELAWNTLKDLLFYEGFETKTPREAIRKAFETEYLTEEEIVGARHAVPPYRIIRDIIIAVPSVCADTIIRRPGRIS